MEPAAEWVEHLLEEVGYGTATAIRSFVRAFPPAAWWGEPWPPGVAMEDIAAFAPSASSYAAALQEVATGRRRIRIQGRWAGGETGTLHAGARKPLSDEQSEWSILSFDIGNGTSQAAEHTVRDV